MIKVLWYKFKQSSFPFTVLVLKGSSETGLFRHPSNHLFRVRNFENTKSMRVIFFSEKNREKNFCFWDSCIWIGIVKLSLLRTRYLPSAATVLTSSPKTRHVNRESLSNSIALVVFHKCDKIPLINISIILWPVYHVGCPRVVWNSTFQTFICPCF